MSGVIEVDLNKIIELGKTSSTLETDGAKFEGHFLTVKHIGSNPTQATLQDYPEVISKALGKPADFDTYHIDIKSNETIVSRDDVPVHAFGSKRKMQHETGSPQRPRKEQKVFNAAIHDLDATISEIADELDITPLFARQTLEDL